MPDLKPCPFCGAVLEYEEHVAILVLGQHRSSGGE